MPVEEITMANRFEHEFPSIRWQAVPDDVERETIRRAVERGRQLRAEAIRHGGRAGLRALRSALGRAMALVRCTALSLGGQPEAADCWRGSPRRA
jgi:hypothetical protein